MRQKLGFVLSIALVGCMILATRFYEIDLPVWLTVLMAKRSSLPLQ
jgi:hypothetical protein